MNIKFQLHYINPWLNIMCSPYNIYIFLNTICQCLGINYWLKSQLLDITDVGQYEQFWLGARSTERHSEGNPGEWIWDHKNETVNWFDWADGQPNNQQGQYCLVMREYHNPFFPVARDYFWNDFDCDASAHYICENTCKNY